MLLNFKQQGNGSTVLLIHGLFGSLDNLGLLARHLEKDHHVISVDLRNHGRSFHSEEISYEIMANDIFHLMEHLDIPQFSVVGHSMGGKVAMTLAALYPERITQLAILDMAPVPYLVRRHDNVFAGLNAVIQGQPEKRSDADALMAQHIQEPGVRQFLSKSLFKNEQKLEWRFNVAGLLAQYDQITGWKECPPYLGPTLFVKGQHSDYIQAEHKEAIMKQFPTAKAHMVANTGHWLHAEKPEAVNRVIERFLVTAAH